MAVIINGSGTITGLAAGGLPDGIVQTADLADDAVTIAKLSATGTASSSTFLRGDGAFAEAGGGKIGAYATDSTSTSYTFTTNTMQNGVLSAAITPTKASSKILVLVGTYCKNAAQPDHGVHAKTRVNRQVASGSVTKLFESYHARSVYTNGYSGNRIENYGTMHPSHLMDTPTYTLGDAITYTLDVGYQGNTGGVDAVYWNSDVEKLSTMTVMELTT